MPYRHPDKIEIQSILHSSSSPDLSLKGEELIPTSSPLLGKACPVLDTGIEMRMIPH